MPASAALQAASLKKYRKLHDMDDLPPGASKEDMIPAVAKHFSQQVYFSQHAAFVIFFWHKQYSNTAYIIHIMSHDPPHAEYLSHAGCR